MFEKIRESNPDLKIYHVKDSCFAEYGRIIHGIDCNQLMAKLEERSIPKEGNSYIASDPELEQLSIVKVFKTEFFGGLPIQIGYCNGQNTQLNALEYHKCPELNVATTDIVLFLGKTSKIKADTYDTKDIVAFYVPKGVLIELEGTTMHFSPCKTNETGFKVIVVLLKGSNEDFSPEQLRDVQSKTLFKVNKWLLAHPENKVLIDRGGYPGLKGKNFQLKPSNV